MVLMAHAVAGAGWKGRWLTRAVIKQLDYIRDHLGCTRMIAEITSPLAARIWRRFGFIIEDGMAVKEFTKNG
ncbi:MAG: hypothetical protein ACRDHG_04590 [Anaerolineales bacterium]